MRNLFASGSNRSPIGLDIGSRSVKAIQLRRGSGGVFVGCMACFERHGEGIHPDQEEIARIESVLFRRGFVGRTVVLGIPRSDAIYEEIERPPSGAGVPVGQIVAAEIGRVQRIDPSSIEHTWWDVPGAGHRESTVMALAASRDPILGAVQSFEANGLEVVRAEPTLTAMSRTAGLSERSSVPFTILVDAGWSGVSIGVLHEDSIVYQRNSDELGLESCLRRAGSANPAGVLRGLREGVSALDPPTRRAIPELAAGLASEIEVSLGYASHRFRLEKSGAVCIYGVGGTIEEVNRQANEVDGIETCKLDAAPFAQVAASSKDRSVMMPAFALAKAGGGAW